MSTKPYSYFDEAYFQDGQKRGTAYVNYKEGARTSPTFREIALAVCEIFRPRRVLEIGCATGIIVRHLNELGCEAHGIDVSEWAVRNAEHPNVRLASAEALPYPDNHFDLVLSCHSLEHLPDTVFDHALAEITRVSIRFHFHMLPILGTPPYDGDPATVREQLKKDPTHQQIHDLNWWLQKFHAAGHLPVDGCILFKHDTSTGELSTCQFITTVRPEIPQPDLLRRASARNQRLFRDLQLGASSQGPAQLRLRGTGRLSYQNRTWKDVERRLGDLETVDLSTMVFQLVVIVDSTAPCTLRFAAGQDIPNTAYAHVGEYHLLAHPGCNIFRFTAENLRLLRGKPNYSRINHLALGGENEHAEILFYLGDQHGVPVLS